MVLRCSSLPLAFRCAGSVHNDGGVLVDEWCQAGEDGTDVHRLLASHVEGDAPKALVDELTDDARILYYTGAKMWREHISAWMPNPQAEVPFEDGHSSELTAHIDVLSVSLDVGAAAILDWKSGRKDTEYKAQGFGYAVKVFERYQHVDTVTVHFAWLRTQELESYTVTRERAIAWMRDELAKVKAWDGVFHPGDHCTGCKRRASCPAHEAMNKQSLTVLAGGPVNLATMPSPDIAAMWRRLSPLAKQIEDLQNAIKAESVARDGIDDGAGRILHYREENGPREVDTLKAWNHLREKMNDGELASCLKVRLGEVEAVLAKKAGKSKGAQAKRDLDAKLKELGAVKQEKRTKFVDERKE